MAGYSGTPLARKSGIREGDRIGLLGAPPGLESSLDGLPGGVELRTRAQGVSTRSSPSTPGGSISSAGSRRCFVYLPLGLVDIKGCAVDGIWSGLRVVWRKELRASRRRGEG
ncbi:MAG: DUF3052 domain-containing protein [Acidimicrobiales bacterium]